SATLPADHPAHVYLNEAVLHSAVADFLSTATFGPDRVTYWERCLDAAGAPEPSAPLADRLDELDEEVADLERRLSRQVANLEGNDVTPTLRRRIADRVA